MWTWLRNFRLFKQWVEFTAHLSAYQFLKNDPTLCISLVIQRTTWNDEFYNDRNKTYLSRAYPNIRILKDKNIQAHTHQQLLMKAFLLPLKRSRYLKRLVQWRTCVYWKLILISGDDRDAIYRSEHERVKRLQQQPPTGVQLQHGGYDSLQHAENLAQAGGYAWRAADELCWLGFQQVNQQGLPFILYHHLRPCQFYFVRTSLFSSLF
jgi:hypothetical protein